jgi:hypothetical protein
MLERMQHVTWYALGTSFTNLITWTIPVVGFNNME